MRRFYLICTIIMLAFCLPSLQSQGKDAELSKILSRLNDQSKAFVFVAKKVTPAVVNISVTREVSSPSLNDEIFRHFFKRFGRELPQRHKMPRRKKYQRRGLGSGVIVDKRGYILTNNHVVRNADEIIIRLFDKRKYKAKVVGTDVKTDVAVLKIQAKNLPVAKIGNSEKLEVGEWVLAIGNPFGLSHTVTAGIISAKGRAGVGVAQYENFLQTDAAINPGNSGGPLVNLKGEIIGINTAIASRSGGYQGIGFAIPSNMAKSVMMQIINEGKVSRGWLGVQIQSVNSELAKSFGLAEVYGVLVAMVVKNSPADKAGIKQEDVILKYNDVKITDVNQLRNLVAGTKPYQRVPVIVFRRGKKIKLHIKIGNLAKAKWETAVKSGISSHEFKKLGISISELTPEKARQYGYENISGVVITEIEEGSIAERVGLQKGDLILRINYNRVTNVSEAIKALNKARNLVRMLIRSGKQAKFVVIPKK